MKIMCGIPQDPIWNIKCVSKNKNKSQKSKSRILSRVVGHSAAAKKRTAERKAVKKTANNAQKNLKVAEKAVKVSVVKEKASSSKPSSSSTTRTVTPAPQGTWNLRWLAKRRGKLDLRNRWLVFVALGEHRSLECGPMQTPVLAKIQKLDRWLKRPRLQQSSR
jgi:hypothetical protein